MAICPQKWTQPLRIGYGEANTGQGDLQKLETLQYKQDKNR
jgi:hypothetical protein